MSDEAAAAHLALLKSRHVQAVLSDIQMLAHGVPVGVFTLVDRWLAMRPHLTRAHLMAARRECAVAYHPDKGGNAALMKLANEALDLAIARLDEEPLTQQREIA